MAENTETDNTPTEGESTTSEQNVETQQAAPQAAEQEETTSNSSPVNQEMGIKPKGETVEIQQSATETLDGLVEEALKGELSEESQKLVEDNDLGKYLDLIVAGQRAAIEKNDQEIVAIVGSSESYGELQEWGANNLSKDEQESYNNALFSGDMNLAKLAVEGLKAKYTNANGKGPDRIIEGGGTVNESNRPYGAQIDYIRDTQKIEYKQDLKFRQEVEDKRSMSGF